MSLLPNSPWLGIMYTVEKVSAILPSPSRNVTYTNSPWPGIMYTVKRVSAVFPSRPGREQCITVKKRLARFSRLPAGMSLIPSSPWPEIIKIISGQGEFGNGKTANLFLQCTMFFLYKLVFSILLNFFTYFAIMFALKADINGRIVDYKGN
jgi:hypothetical protein